MLWVVPGMVAHQHEVAHFCHISTRVLLDGHKIDHSTSATCSQGLSKTIRNQPTKAQTLWPYTLCPSGTLLASMSISQTSAHLALDFIQTCQAYFDTLASLALGPTISAVWFLSWSSNSHWRTVQCPSISNSADNLLKCIQSFSALSNIHGYFIHSHRFRKWDTKHTFWSVQSAIINVLCEKNKSPDILGLCPFVLWYGPCRWLLPFYLTHWLDHFHHICLLFSLVFQLPTVLPYLLACIKVAHGIIS